MTDNLLVILVFLTINLLNFICIFGKKFMDFIGDILGIKLHNKKNIDKFMVFQRKGSEYES